MCFCKVQWDWEAPSLVRADWLWVCLLRVFKRMSMQVPSIYKLPEEHLKHKIMIKKNWNLLFQNLIVRLWWVVTSWKNWQWLKFKADESFFQIKFFQHDADLILIKVYTFGRMHLTLSYRKTSQLISGV